MASSLPPRSSYQVTLPRLLPLPPQKSKHRSGELRGEMRGIASYLWQRRADFCGSVWRRVGALDLDAAVVANFWCGEWCGACLRICGGLTLGKHQTHDQDSVACLILGRGALGNKPNIPLVHSPPSLKWVAVETTNNCYNIYIV
jgi:thiol-disulfide isomerase/thioredoxin